MGIATYLLDQEAGVDQPVMILSGASRAHFVVQMGACYAGVPVVPVVLVTLRCGSVSKI